MKYVLQTESGVIEDMKTTQRNKCEKLKIANLDTSSIQVAIKT